MFLKIAAQTFEARDILNILVFEAFVAYFLRNIFLIKKRALHILPF